MLSPPSFCFGHSCEPGTDIRLNATPDCREEKRMPDHARFYYLAYAVAVVVYVLYALSIRRRWNRLTEPK